MKRIFAFATFVALVGVAAAQSSFTIRRPVEGATVRETVEVRIPRRAIPSGAGFVGIWINGRFVEAVAPFDGANTSGSDFVYRINTKERRIPDGQMTVEAVLYANRGNFTQPINRTSVVVRLDNSASIRIPAGGLRMRYSFVPNQEFVYRLRIQSSIQNLTDAQAQLGSQAGLIEGPPMDLRYRMTVMNRYQTPTGREGLILMQPLPPRGQSFAMLQLQNDSEPRRYEDFTMAPMYMRLTDTGREVFGSFPFYAPSESSFGEANRFDLYGIFPPPVLPSRGVRPGGPPFASSLVQGIRNETEGYDVSSLAQFIPARGTLESIEYEQGRPTAKIRNVLAQGDARTGVQEFEEIYWFALDLGMPTRVERRFTMTRRIREQVGGGGGAAGGAGGPGGGGAPTGGGGVAGTTGRGDIRPPVGNEWIEDQPGSMSLPGGGLFNSGQLRQVRAGDEEEGREGGMGRAGGQGRGGGMGGGRTGGLGGGGTRTRTRLVRERTTITLILE